MNDFFHGLVETYRLYKTDLDYPIAAAVMATLRHIQLGHERRQIWTNAIMAGMFAKGITVLLTTIAAHVPFMEWVDGNRDVGWIVACILGYVGIDNALRLLGKHFPSMRLRRAKRDDQQV
ncbi:hypothetical protein DIENCEPHELON_42 [Klebsiella phage vB_KaeS_Diencephalon]|nr:hypothetical protein DIENCEPHELON_42 [Klebsiella phage vB_KaeS_Diencephalon]